MAHRSSFSRAFVVRVRFGFVLGGLCLLGLTWLIPACSLDLSSEGVPDGAGVTYYVATNGEDSFDGLAPDPEGGSRGPFRTLSRAASMVKAGDSVEIRVGTYREASAWSASGTKSSPITISSYKGEEVLISGENHTIPSGTYGTLLSIYGSWVNLRDLEVGYSSWYGVMVGGEHCSVIDVASHHNWSSGIVFNGSYGLVESCRAYSNSLINEYHRPHQGTWGFGISACRSPQYTTIRNCRAWNNWGEGISTFESKDITIEDCASYNNQQNFYLSDTTRCLFQRNLSYYTPGNAIQGFVTQNGVLMGNEGRAPACSDNIIINNICLGGERNIAIGSNTFENGLVAFNTFVNASATAGVETANVWINSGTYENARFMNNIILQEDGAAIARVDVRGVKFGYNSWSTSPVVLCRGKGDFIGDPQLSKTGPTGPGELTREWFKLLGGSPVRNRAKPLAEVTEDLFRSRRGATPDMGAHEIGAYLTAR